MMSYDALASSEILIKGLLRAGLEIGMSSESLLDGQPETRLAALLEADMSVRERFRDSGYCTRWPSPQSIGVASVKAMGLNHRILELTALWWCPRCEGPQFIPISTVRKEVIRLTCCNIFDVLGISNLTSTTTTMMIMMMMMVMICCMSNL